jgi:hypothetical protein
MPSSKWKTASMSSSKITQRTRAKSFLLKSFFVKSFFVKSFFVKSFFVKSFLLKRFLNGAAPVARPKGAAK